MNRIFFKYIIILFMLVICLGGFICIKPTFSKFTNDFTTDDNVAEFNYDFDLSINNIEEYELVSVRANGYVIFNVDINNDTVDDIYYGIWYKTTDDNVSISRYIDSSNDTSGKLDSMDTKSVTLIAINNGDSIKNIKIGVVSSKASVNSIEYIGGKKLVSGVSNKPNLSVNEPILDSLMIPVVYDYENEKWVKADSSNINNSWYNYNDKKWANAVLIKSSSKDKYLSSKNGSNIDNNDILAFYVWIPRFKYRVWNVFRDSNSANYSYNAYLNGIDIKWENEDSSSGNLACSYDMKSLLSDNCIYNGTYLINDSNNVIKYDNVWYTHPAFVYGNKSISGFWVGKFETTGSTNSPTILPDNKALVGNDLSSSFAISKKIQSYGISSFSSHIIKNLEWGAVSYLTYSKYGLCKGSGCRDVYLNNSSSLYTGRSAGDVSGSSNISMSFVYNVSGNNNRFSDTGYYNYQGYMFDNDGNLTGSRNINKVASTTGNIYGIYDLVGGASEAVMANGLSSNNTFNLASSGNNWGIVGNLDSVYYDKYAYSKDIYNFNRSRLGDATGELVFKNSNGVFSWKIGSNNVNISNVVWDNPWLVRGGSYKLDDSSIFKFNNYNGSGSNDITFRSVLS